MPVGYTLGYSLSEEWLAVCYILMGFSAWPLATSLAEPLAETLAGTLG